MSSFTPMYDNIIIKPTKAEDQTKSGIYIPDPDHFSECSSGIVLEIGCGRIAGDKIIPLTVKVGDSIIYRKSTEVMLTTSGGEKVMLISEGSVLAIRTDDESEVE